MRLSGHDLLMQHDNRAKLCEQMVLFLDEASNKTEKGLGGTFAVLKHCFCDDTILLGEIFRQGYHRTLI